MNSTINCCPKRVRTSTCKSGRIRPSTSSMPCTTPAVQVHTLTWCMPPGGSQGVQGLQRVQGQGLLSPHTQTIEGGEGPQSVSSSGLLNPSAQAERPTTVAYTASCRSEPREPKRPPLPHCSSSLHSPQAGGHGVPTKTLKHTFGKHTQDKPEVAEGSSQEAHKTFLVESSEHSNISALSLKLYFKQIEGLGKGLSC